MMQNAFLKSALIAGAAAAALAANAEAKGAINVSDLDIDRNGKKVNISMNLDASSLRLPTNREIRYTPMLVNGADTVKFKSFSIAGHNRYYTGIRADGDKNWLMKAGSLKQPFAYAVQTPWQDWMEIARFEIAREECGCCAKALPEDKQPGPAPIAQLDYTPRAFTELTFPYITPKAEAVKIRQISARAYVDFPVNVTKINPDYRRNPQELAKIRATIDSVRADKNVSITGIAIKGFASPEGSYAQNAKLAQGRTRALAEYVRSLYQMRRDMMQTSFDPEDWAGLKEFVASEEGGKVLRNRGALLDLIENPAYQGRDDEREALIRTRFPEDYKYLLANVYPGLRHSDYAVKFSVKSFTDPEEIIKMMKTAPQNLSLQELFVAARSQKPGSPLYNEAFEIAVRMYPDDPVANLNAGIAALEAGEYSRAERYLDKAGDTPEARYSRAILLALEGDKAAALQTLRKIKGYAPAEKSAKQLEELLDTNGSYFTQLADQF